MKDSNSYILGMRQVLGSGKYLGLLLLVIREKKTPSNSSKIEFEKRSTHEVINVFLK